MIDHGDSDGLYRIHICSNIPNVTGNHKRDFVFKRIFLNLIQTTTMNQASLKFANFHGDEGGIYEIEHYVRVVTEDYIVPYFNTSWVKPKQWELSLHTATSHRVKSLGFQIDDIICGG